MQEIPRAPPKGERHRSAGIKLLNPKGISTVDALCWAGRAPPYFIVRRRRDLIAVGAHHF